MDKEIIDLLKVKKGTANVDIWTLISILPRQTHNGEAFGLTIQTANDQDWSVCYYSHYSKKTNSDIPVMIGKSHGFGLIEALDQMIAYFYKNYPNQLLWD